MTIISNKFFSCWDPDEGGRSNLLKSRMLSSVAPRNCKNKFYYLLMFLILLITCNSFSQSLRGLVNDGVENYNEKSYSDAEVNFKKGTEKSPESFEAKFNLGDALFKQERYDEAISSYQSSMHMAKSDLEKAKVHYNIGNSLLKSQKIKDSIEEYKQSLKFNPYDQEAKYNLSYALEMLKNQNEQKQQQNKDQDQQQNKDDNQEKNENKDEQKQDQKKDQQSKQDNTKQQQQQPQKISKEEAERILEALKDNEKDLQKELRKIKGKRVKTDKDW